MNRQAQSNVWPRPWFAGTIGTVSDLVIKDGGSDSMPLSASEKTTVGLAGEERVGSDADDAIVARVALVGQVWAQREIWFRFAPMVYGLFRRALGPRHPHVMVCRENYADLRREMRCRKQPRRHSGKGQS